MISTALPPEYTDFRRQCRVAAVRLRVAAGLTGEVTTDVPLEKAVVECVESFRDAKGHRDGRRSDLIRAWTPILSRVTTEVATRHLAIR